MFASGIALTGGAIISTASLVAMNLADPLAAGKEVGGFTTAEVLGVVAVSCVLGMVIMYWQQRKIEDTSRKAHDAHTDRLYHMIEAATSAAKEQSDVSRELVKSISDMRVDMTKCARA